MKVIAILIFSFILIVPFNSKSQIKSLSGIHDPIDSALVDIIESYGFAKVTYYFDNLNMKDGQWNLYPFLNLSKDIIAVNISTIPDQASVYNFIIIIDKTLNSVIDTIGPFYDTFVDGIDATIKNNKVDYLIIRLYNPPEPDEPKYTIIEYKKKKMKLEKIKEYNKD